MVICVLNVRQLASPPSNSSACLCQGSGLFDDDCGSLDQGHRARNGRGNLTLQLDDSDEDDLEFTKPGTAAARKRKQPNTARKAPGARKAPKARKAAPSARKAPNGRQAPLKAAPSAPKAPNGRKAPSTPVASEKKPAARSTPTRRAKNKPPGEEEEDPVDLLARQLGACELVHETTCEEELAKWGKAFYTEEWLNKEDLEVYPLGCSYCARAFVTKPKNQVDEKAEVKVTDKKPGKCNQSSNQIWQSINFAGTPL